MRERTRVLAALISLVGLLLSVVALAPARADVAKPPRPPKPAVTKVKPKTGPTTGGTKVTVKGRHLTGAKKVLFGSTKGRKVKVAKSGRKLTVVAPAHAAGVVAVRVVTKGGKSKKTKRARFTYVAGPATTSTAPTLTSVAPTSGPTAGGTAVTLTGTNLTGTSVVSFGGTPAASVTVTSPSEVRAVSPPHAAGAVQVTVTTPLGTSTPATFTYTAPATTAPVVLAVLPPVGPTGGGTAVTIAGSGFTGTTSVTFGGVAATNVVVTSDNTITARTPNHALGPVNVTVTNSAGPGVGASLFTYITAPTVLAVLPITGTTDGGTSVTITGTGFTGATQVVFGGAAATNVQVVSDSQITATTPPHAAGLVSVTVSNPVGAGIGVGLYTYAGGGGGGGGGGALPPVVLLAAPPTGPHTGGTSVTITGSGFTGATAVKFGDTAASSVTVNSDTSITAVTPAHPAGPLVILDPVSITVTTPAGAGVSPGLFAYLL